VCSGRGAHDCPARAYTRSTVTQTQPIPMHSTSRTRSVFLVGFMGAGKTSVGLLLGQRLGWRFVDLDRQIEARVGKTVAVIFREMGETAFREMETEALQKLLHALRDGDPTVIALGGGAFIQPVNRELLESSGARVIYLDAPIDELRRRLGEDDVTRPLFLDAERFRLLYEERQPLYRMAPHRVQTSGKTVIEVAREIESLLGES
jgi:shikimate kinase